jgi:hypothetical protein
MLWPYDDIGTMTTKGKIAPDGESNVCFAGVRICLQVRHHEKYLSSIFPVTPIYASDITSKASLKYIYCTMGGT